MNKRGPWALAGLALLVAGAHWAALAGLAPALAAPAPPANAPRAVWVAAVPPGVAARGNATHAGAAEPLPAPAETTALLARAEATAVPAVPAVSSATAVAATVPTASVVRIAAPLAPSPGAGQGLAESVLESTVGADAAPLQPDAARPRLRPLRLGQPAPTPDSSAPTPDSAPMPAVAHAGPASAAEVLESAAAPTPEQAATPAAPLRIAASAAGAAPAARAASVAPSVPAAPAARAAPAALLRTGTASPSALPASAAASAADAGEAVSSEAQTGAPPAGPAPPIYATRIPPAARVLYRMSRSGIVGTGELDWRPQGMRSYVLTLEGRLPIFGALIVQTSRGGFDAAGLAPERFTDKRLRRGEQAANFQRQAGKITFSGPSTELPLLAGVQDRLSVMLQLAAIAGAWRQPHRVGERFEVAVVGARGDSHLWSLRYEGRDAVATPEGSVSALRFVRVPEGPYDTLAEFWLDAARSYLPVRVRLTDGKGDALELLREAKVP